MHVHIDGDILIFRCGFAAEKKEYTLLYDDGEIVEKYTYKKDLDLRISNLGLEEGEYIVTEGRVVEPVENALYNVKSVINTILAATTPDAYTLYLSGGENYRDGVATIKPYKGNRDKAHRPTHEKKIKEYMTEQWGAVHTDGEEADDMIGYSHYKLWTSDPYSSCIATTDKDLDMIPGLHYNFVREESYDVAPEDADKWFYQQLLMGDSTDNIPGIPGVGAVRAAKAIEESENHWKTIQEFYESAYKADWKAALIENARLLWIRRHPDEWWNLPEEIN